MLPLNQSCRPVQLSRQNDNHTDFFCLKQCWLQDLTSASKALKHPQVKVQISDIEGEYCKANKAQTVGRQEVTGHVIAPESRNNSQLSILGILTIRLTSEKCLPKLHNKKHYFCGFYKTELQIEGAGWPYGQVFMVIIFFLDTYRYCTNRVILSLHL